MKWIAIVVAVVAALILVVAVVGALLPRAHRASSSVVVPAPVDAVWRTIRDVAAATTWWPGLTVSERLPDAGGRERWHQKGGGFDMTIEIVESTPPARLTTLIVSQPGDPYGGKWIYVLQPEGTGTRITLTEDGWVSNVIFRFVSRFVVGHYATPDHYLTALAKKCGVSVRPEHVL